ncbi:MAG: gluconate 2-dehydrogenase subunit 3 family protein [Polyangiaceae bacterium]|nr:gluconate 2-dehydrogenase subunit 3 family protein [Polyangiaceae bacterium]
MQLSRRSALGLGAVGTVALVAAGSLRWFTHGYPPGAQVLLALGDKEQAIVTSLVDALIDGGEGLPTADDAGVVQRIDEQLWGADVHTQSDLRAALQVVEHAPILFGAPGRFTSLSRRRRVEVLRAMLASKRDVFVQVATALKQLTMLCYYSAEASWGAIGYDGPWIKEEKLPPSTLRYRSLLAAKQRGEA